MCMGLCSEETDNISANIRINKLQRNPENGQFRGKENTAQTQDTEQKQNNNTTKKTKMMGNTCDESRCS